MGSNAGRFAPIRRLMLTALAQEYLSAHALSWEWHAVFDSRAGELLRTRTLVAPPGYPSYQRLLIYGASCNESLRDDPEVIGLLEASACHRSLEGIRSPWCRTHQLMGLLLVQRNECEPARDTSATVARVQDAIRAELEWDFRVEDAYIQKVMMLAQSQSHRLHRRKPLPAHHSRSLCKLSRHRPGTLSGGSVAEQRAVGLSRIGVNQSGLLSPCLWRGLDCVARDTPDRGAHRHTDPRLTHRHRSRYVH